MKEGLEELREQIISYSLPDFYDYTKDEKTKSIIRQSIDEDSKFIRLMNLIEVEFTKTRLDELRRLYDAYNDNPNSDANLFEERVKELESTLTTQLKKGE